MHWGRVVGYLSKAENSDKREASIPIWEMHSPFQV